MTIAYIPIIYDLFRPRSIYQYLRLYLSMFKSQQYKIRGEVDPSYIHYENTLKNIEKFNSAVKLYSIENRDIDISKNNELFNESNTKKKKKTRKKDRRKSTKSIK